MKHKNLLLAWACRFHYPYLRLSKDDHVAHGEEAWRSLTRGSKKRQLLAWQRIDRWNKLLEREAS